MGILYSTLYSSSSRVVDGHTLLYPYRSTTLTIVLPLTEGHLGEHQQHRAEWAAQVSRRSGSVATGTAVRGHVM